MAVCAAVDFDALDADIFLPRTAVTPPFSWTEQAHNWSACSHGYVRRACIAAYINLSQPRKLVKTLQRKANSSCLSGLRLPRQRVRPVHVRRGRRLPTTAFHSETRVHRRDARTVRRSTIWSANRHLDLVLRNCRCEIDAASTLSAGEVPMGNERPSAESGVGMPKAPLASIRFFRMTCVFGGIGMVFDRKIRLAGSLNDSRANPKTRRAPERRAMEADLSKP